MPGPDEAPEPDPNRPKGSIQMFLAWKTGCAFCGWEVTTDTEEEAVRSGEEHAANCKGAPFQ